MSRFNNSSDRARVTPFESPGSERTGFLHPFVLKVARGALVALSRAGDRVLARGAQALALAEGIVTAADAIVDGLDRLDGCAQPEAPAAVDLGQVLRVEELAERLARLESAVGRLEARHPARVVERRRSRVACPACSETTTEILEGVMPSSGWLNGLCAGCGSSVCIPESSEVLP